MSLLVARAIDKSFAGVHALRGVSFELRPGEVHAIVGENGAGKSTLIRIIAGAETPDAGSLVLAGRTVDRFHPSVARACGVAVVYQQPALCPDLTVAENIALVLEPPNPWSRVNRAEQRARAAALLEEVGTSIDPDRLAGTLSFPEQQLVEIARGIGADARIVLLDEPTASLTDREVEHLHQVVRRLCARGAGIIYISHRLAEVMAISDRVTVLRDGASVDTLERAELARHDLVRLMVGRAASSDDIVTIDYGRHDRGNREPPALELRHLSNRSLGLRDVSLAVHRGEIVGLAGLVGSGRTELAETVFGLTPPDAGEIRIDGVVQRLTSPADAIRRRLAYVPEDRRRHGVVADMTIRANTSLASLRQVSRAGLIDRTREQAIARGFVAQLRVKAPSAEVPVATLSGGNQQKIALARWLATDPKVLILDEPTQGIDVGAKAEIHAIIRDLAGRGLAILLISSELSEVLAMSDRIAVMYRGTLQGILPRAEATPERVMSLALGHADSAQDAPC